MFAYLDNQSILSTVVIHFENARQFISRTISDGYNGASHCPTHTDSAATTCTVAKWEGREAGGKIPPWGKGTYRHGVPGMSPAPC